MKKVIVIVAVLAIAAGLVVVPVLAAGKTGAVPANGSGGPGASGRPGMSGGPGMPGNSGGGPDRSGANSGANSGGTVFAVRTADAEIRSLQSYIEVNGNIVSAQQVAVVPEAAGKLASMKTEIGARVTKGALVAEIDPSRPGSVYSLSPVYAPVSGTVVTNPAAEGSTVSTATTLFTIAVGENIGDIEIEAMIPEREVGQLRTGLKAEVRLEAFSGEVFAAELTRLSPVVDPASRTKKVTLRFVADNQGIDRRINPGMFARVKLNTRVYPNVVSVPQEAVVENRGQTAVYVLDASAAGETARVAARVAAREVVTGVTIDGETEIKAGLSAGEAVVYQGQQFLTDGALVRVIGSQR
ncbi:MAG: efflux RND transporter periplasmic adaptor subunit [Spirochaetaceae bacterium]|jgi:multidrug efflux pump subunit AcrA (membrane-fusion protein)|nr:efflux RND transporter periplasmic adaptor subunit [Spirochaetaceae bacterium]